ncbi:MAG: aminotransferase class I/II-fold pyridoxal phosphate-dependent enzyme [Pseudomonadota bacterium]
MPAYAKRTAAIAGEGAAAWDILTASRQAKAAGEDVIIMSVGDPDFDTPVAIVDAAVAALRAGDTHYTSVVGRPELRRAIAAQFESLGGPATRAEQVAVFAGTQNALFAAAQVLLDPGSHAISIDPQYVTYDAAIGVTGAELTRVPPKDGIALRPDVDAVAASVRPDTRALFFANPCNPTGIVYTRDELEGLADIARAHDLWVVSDEVYGTLTFEQPHIPTASLAGMAERTITLSSVSKSHAMTGWRLGWMIGPDSIAEHAANLALCMLYGAPGFTQAAATEALTGSRDAPDAMRELYRRRRDLATATLQRAPALRVLPAEAGMFLVVDVSGTGMNGHDFSWALYRETGVSVLGGAAFSDTIGHCVRLSFTVSDDEIVEGCERVVRFCGGLAS